jgi:hypothetical protein
MTLLESSDTLFDIDPMENFTYGDEEKKRGAVYTKASVVDFMLDLMGYSISKPLFENRLLEPSFGGGRFLLAAIDRLLVSWKISERKKKSSSFLGQFGPSSLTKLRSQSSKATSSNI